MIVKVQLEKQFSDIINKQVNFNNNIVGNIISYDNETSIATIEISDDNFFDDYHEITAHHIGVSNIKYTDNPCSKLIY